MTRFIAALSLSLALLSPVRSAEAHPRLVSSTPTANGHVAAAPTEIGVTFNENITVALSKLTMLNASQQPMALDSLRSGTDAKTLVAKTTGTLAPGRYTVKWQAAGSDGHPMRGEFSFVIDAPTPPAKITTPSRRQ